MDEQQPCGDPQIQYVPMDLGRAGSAGYSESHYRFLNEIIESKTAREFFQQITNTDFSAQCVNAFYKVLTTGFDKNAILAKYTREQITIRVIDYDILLNLMVLECHESDIQNPAFITFTENIRSAFRDFINRSQTERDQLLKQEFGIQPVVQQQGSVGGQQPPKPTVGGLGRGM